MKKIVLLLLVLIPFFLQAQITISTSAYVHGYWTNWEQRYSSNPWACNDLLCAMTYNSFSEGNVFNGMEFRNPSLQKWEWCFKFEVNTYIRSDKKERKNHLNSNQWYEYQGWVEYYVTDEYPTIEKVLEHYQFPMVDPNGMGARAKRRTKATIRIAPYKKEPECFNIYFDGVGVGISFNKWPFEKSYVVQ